VERYRGGFILILIWNLISFGHVSYYLFILLQKISPLGGEKKKKKKKKKKKEK
jgi:hypothetical protein